jgi:hypothetical protein
MTEEQKPQKWWSTVPGILTATAGTITAITGLVVALNQAGLFSMTLEQGSETQVRRANSPSSESERSAETSASLDNAGSSIISQGDQYPRQLASGTEVQLANVKYKLLRVQLARYSVEKLALTFTIQMTNASKYPTNFWDASFRLLVDGVQRSPISGLNKLVQGESAEEGDVVFVIPEATTSVVLRVLQGDESTELPISLLPGPATMSQRK